VWSIKAAVSPLDDVVLIRTDEGGTSAL